jgi:GrpB-like predicted nucleotidyltransferase (UPF0157 family)
MNHNTIKRIQELIQEETSIVPYDPAWPDIFEEEAAFLRGKLPQNLVKRIEHFGSTAVPGLSAKPIVDMLVEVTSLEGVKEHVVPVLETEGYEYFWRPAFGDDGPPYYAWFIKRNAEGRRTHHIHMVEADSELWDRIYFRDYLRQFPMIARQYDELKRRLSDEHTNDRVGYTEAKSGFIQSTTTIAKEYYRSRNEYDT